MAKLDMSDGHADALVAEGGIYLLIVDESPEFQKALKAASALAFNNKAYIALLYVIEPPDFQQWGAVEDKIIAEQKRKAGELMLQSAQMLNEMHGHKPSFHIMDGKVRDVTVEVIEHNPEIKALVLGVGEGSNPLVTYFSGKGLSSLKIPLFIIPGQT